MLLVFYLFIYLLVAGDALVLLSYQWRLVSRRPAWLENWVWTVATWRQDAPTPGPTLQTQLSKPVVLRLFGNT